MRGILTYHGQFPFAGVSVHLDSTALRQETNPEGFFQLEADQYLGTRQPFAGPKTDFSRAAGPPPAYYSADGRFQYRETASDPPKAGGPLPAQRGQLLFSFSSTPIFSGGAGLGPPRKQASQAAPYAVILNHISVATDTLWVDPLNQDLGTLDLPLMYMDERQGCVDRINAFRATENLPPLERWLEQEPCVDSQAKSDSETGKAHGAFGECRESAQNECPGWRVIDDINSDCLQMMWDEGPYDGPWDLEHGHYLNMNNPDYTRVACGFYLTPGGRVWAIQNFR